MPFLTALDSTRYNALRGNGSPRTYKASQFMCILSNTILLSARVNQTTFAASFAQITFDTVTEGAYTDVIKDALVLISHTNDKRQAYFEGRARADNSGVMATATVLNINETSETITDNDYIWVIRDVRPYHELGIVSGGAYKKDYARTFFQLRPIISGLQSAYAGIVSGSPAGFTVSFAATAIAAASGATISSYAYTLPVSGATVTAGATNTANVTVRFDASATEYWIKLIVTDSGGRTQTRYIPVWAVPANLSTTVVRGFMGAHIEGSWDNGWSATVDAFAGVSDMLDGTLCCIFDVEYYQETAYSLFSTVKFVGRFRKETNETTADEVYSTKRKATFEIEGTAAQLARISSPEITARDTVTPTVWDEIKALTIWRAITYLLEHSTFHQSFSLSFDSTDNTFRAFQLEVASGSQFDGVKDLAQAINGMFLFAPTGEAQVVRDARYLNTAARNALTTVADLSPIDWINFTLERDYFETVGLVEASGGSYAPTGGGVSATAVRAYLSIAPGVAQGNGDGTAPLARQILAADVPFSTAQAEMNVRAGNHFAASNPTPSLNVDMRGAYNWLIPAVNQWYTWAIGTGDNRRGLLYSTGERWLLKSVSIDHDNVRGNKTVSAQFILETSGADLGVGGQTVVIPPVNNVSPVLPSLPPFTPNPYTPPPPDVYLPPDPIIDDLPPILIDPIGVPLDGNAVAIHSTDHVWVTKTFITTPTWSDVTPDDIEGTVRDMAGEGYGLYVLTSDGTNSWVYYISNPFGIGQAWAVSETLTGEYTQIRTTSTLGTVIIKGSIGPGETVTNRWDLTTDTHGGTVPAPGGTATEGFGQFDGTGLSSSTIPNGTATYFAYATGFAGYTNVTKVTVHASVDTANMWVGLDAEYADVGLTQPTSEGADGDGYFKSWDVTDPPMDDFTTFSVYADNQAQFYIDWIELEYETASDTEFTRLSVDLAATFASEIQAGVGGIDTEKIGVPVLVGSEGQIKISTVSGGEYADYGSALPADFLPLALVVPRKTFAGGNNINTNTPVFLVASSAVDTDDETVYKITASGVTQTPITPIVSGDKFLALGGRCIAISWWTSNRIAGVGMFGSLPRLVTSTNGSTFTDRGVLTEDALSVCFRKGDTTSLQLYGCDGQPWYSPNFGASLYYKSYPADRNIEPVLGLVVFG